jgi:hypothetical protein
LEVRYNQSGRKHLATSGELKQEEELKLNLFGEY